MLTPLEKFAISAQEAGVRLQVSQEQITRAARGSGDDLFHVPLIALCILVVARAKRGTFITADLAAWTGATLVQHFTAMQAQQQKLEWSLQHRRRCADALVFVESLGLVSVVQGTDRGVRCSASGFALIGKLLREENDTGFLVRGLERAHRVVQHRGLELL